MPRRILIIDDDILMLEALALVLTRTGYEVLTQYDHPVCALVECRLETGRTHQIRVHLAAIGHPVVGDGTYGGDRNPLQPGRPFLHAHALALAHPVTGEHLEFSDPLPAELMAVLSRLEL